MDEPEVRGFIITCNFVILLLFCAELVIKVVATGFTTPGKGYIHDSWNRLARQTLLPPSDSAQTVSTYSSLLLVFGRSNSGVDLPSRVKSVPNPCLTPRVLRPPCRTSLWW